MVVEDEIFLFKDVLSFLTGSIQKKPSRDVLKKRCLKNMQQTYRRIY